MFKKLFYLTCFVLVLSIAGSASAQLMVHYKLNETSGTTALDASGKGNDGVVTGEPNWVPGVVGGGLRFSPNATTGPVDANGITIPAYKMGMRSDSGSVAFWMNLSSMGTGINTIWWGGDNTTGSGMGPENEMHIHVEVVVANIWRGGELCFRVLHGTPTTIHLHSDPNKGDASQQGNAPVSPILVNDGQWHHVTGTWGDDNGNVNLYLDGQLLQSAAFLTPSYPLTNMFLGKMAGGGRVYNGILDEVQIYGRAITQAEIRDIIAGTPALSLLAAMPEPGNRVKDVPRDADLKWFGGDTAAKHNVYFGRDFNDVNEAAVANPCGVLVGQNQAATTFPLNTLDWDTTYYWRIDEIEADGTTIHTGQVWSFTVCNFVLVDDFEIYDVNNTIFSVWSDYAVNSTGMTAGYFNAPYIEQTLGLYHSGKQSMPLRYDNDGTVNDGTTYQKTGTRFYSEVERKWATTQNWTLEDVNSLSLWYKGYPAYVGSFVEAPAGTYTIRSTGKDIYDTADEFHFAYKEVTSGACSIIAKVESLDPNIDPNEMDTKAGVMIRDSLDANSVNAALVLTPAPDRGLRFQYRITTAGTTTRGDADLDPNVHAPYWLRLERSAGGLIRAYRSPNGTTQWTMFTLQAPTMKMPIYIGLAVTSHDVTKVYEAKFSNVQFPSNAALTSQAWKDIDIGIKSNEIEPMYMVINGKTIYNEDPNAALINQWNEWSIPLKKFTDLGVNLTNVSSFGIGLGNKSSTQAGGEGTIFIDDVRLYRPPRQ